MGKKKVVAEDATSVAPTGAARPTLLDKVKAACVRLSRHGWGQLFLAHGLNISAGSLADELMRPLKVDRSLPGFEDFAADGIRGVEPGKPALSLLYHAFASPNVVANTNGTPLSKFPTPAEIEAVENYIYGVRPPTLEELRRRAGSAPLAVVVFASEYRPASSSVHRLHAEMCFARTGGARIGTAGPEYLPPKRG